MDREGKHRMRKPRKERSAPTPITADLTPKTLNPKSREVDIIVHC